MSPHPSPARVTFITMIDSVLVRSTDLGRGATRAEDAQEPEIIKTQAAWEKAGDE